MVYDPSVILGRPEHFTRAHYEAQRGLAPGPLCEQVVHALELLAQASAAGLSFRFKGGNSLLLILDEPRRFSIDIDVDARETKERLVEAMEAIIAGCEAFTRLEVRAHKTKPWLPMISFNVHYRSAFPAEGPTFVMFDAVLKESPGRGVRRRVRAGGLYEAGVEVEVNTPSGLAGDKVLTLGPATLGIPLGKGKATHRLKHVFDLGRLSEVGLDPAETRAALEGCLRQENEIQRSAWTWAEVAADTLRLCDAALRFEAAPDPATIDPADYAREVAEGFPAFRSHLFRGAYDWADLRGDFERVRVIVRSL